MALGGKQSVSRLLTPPREGLAATLEEGSSRLPPFFTVFLPQKVLPGAGNVIMGPDQEFLSTERRGINTVPGPDSQPS